MDASKGIWIDGRVIMVVMDGWLGGKDGKEGLKKISFVACSTTRISRC